MSTRCRSHPSKLLLLRATESRIYERRHHFAAQGWMGFGCRSGKSRWWGTFFWPPGMLRTAAGSILCAGETPCTSGSIAWASPMSRFPRWVWESPVFIILPNNAATWSDPVFLGVVRPRLPPQPTHCFEIFQITRIAESIDMAALSSLIFPQNAIFLALKGVSGVWTSPRHITSSGNRTSTAWVFVKGCTNRLYTLPYAPQMFHLQQLRPFKQRLLQDNVGMYEWVCDEFWWIVGCGHSNWSCRTLTSKDSGSIWCTYSTILSWDCNQVHMQLRMPSS